MSMDRQQIIMNFTTAPSVEDLQVIALEAIAALPEELTNFCESIGVQVEDLPDDAIVLELDLEDPFDLVALFRSGNQIAPGVESKVANDDDVLMIYRRPLLDMWCETGEDLNALVRQIIIEELGQNFDFSDSEIDDMTRRYVQGLV